MTHCDFSSWRLASRPELVTDNRSLSARVRCDILDGAPRLAALVEHALLDDVLRPQHHQRRDRQAERLRGLEVNRQLELGGLLDGGVGGVRALWGSGGGAPPKPIHFF